jgi:hypothetical protein
MIVRVGLVTGMPSISSRSSGGTSNAVCTTTPMRRTLRSRVTVMCSGLRNVNPSKPCSAAAVGADAQHGSPMSSTSARRSASMPGGAPGRRKT